MCMFLCVYIYIYFKSKHTNFSNNMESNLYILYKHYEVGYISQSISGKSLILWKLVNY